MARANGEGTLQKRGKYWLAIWTVNGKRHTRSTKCTNKKDAVDKLAEFIKPFKLGDEEETLAWLESKLKNAKAKKKTNEPTRVTFMYERYKKDVTVSEVSAGTHRLYETKVAVLEKFCKKHDITYVHELTKSLVEEFLKEVKEKTSPDTFNTYLVCLRKIVEVLMRSDDNIEHNWFADFKKLKGSKNVWRRELTAEELESLFTTLADEYDEETQLLFQIGQYTGLRCGDCALLKWKSEVDFKSRMIRVLPIKTCKNGKMAIIPMHEELYKMLKEQFKKTGKDEYVIPSIAERYKIGNGNLAKHIERIFAKAGIRTSEMCADGHVHTTTGFHVLRHIFISKCMRAGIPISQTMQMVAHSDAKMSLHYTHTNESDLHLPEFRDDLVEVKIKKTSYNKLMELIRDNESFEDCLERVIKTGAIDFEAIKKADEERKRKEDAEVDKMIDEVYGKGFVGFDKEHGYMYKSEGGEIITSDKPIASVDK